MCSTNEQPQVLGLSFSYIEITFALFGNIINMGFVVIILTILIDCIFMHSGGFPRERILYYEYPEL